MGPEVVSPLSGIQQVYYETSTCQLALVFVPVPSGRLHLPTLFQSDLISSHVTPHTKCCGNQDSCIPKVQFLVGVCVFENLRNSLFRLGFNRISSLRTSTHDDFTRYLRTPFYLINKKTSFEMLQGFRTGPSHLRFRLPDLTQGSFNYTTSELKVILP